MMFAPIPNKMRQETLGSNSLTKSMNGEKDKADSPASSGMVFNIMRYSVNDGPGIRTTVFLKGCPLRCRWCHNPESISPRREIAYRQDRCLKCGDCLAACPHGAIVPLDGYFITLRKRCHQCGTCVQVCVSDAREIVGKEMTVAQVMEEVEKDIVFYDESGGGVTFSGGEPLDQAEFLLGLLKACKENGIHTAIDTTGFAAPERLETVSGYADLFLYDLKILNDAKHVEFTGASNALILSNLKLLVSMGSQVIVRVPIIPRFNDNLVDIHEMGEFVASLGGIKEIDLLPFHEIGRSKYERLGIECTMPESTPPSEQELNQVVDELSRFGVQVRIGG
jgi:pyruvate formate lyase activating enzyme